MAAFSSSLRFAATILCPIPPILCWLTVFSTLAFGAIGLPNDYIKGGSAPQPGPDRARQAVLAGIAGAAVP